jgi:hypothetical protein
VEDAKPHLPIGIMGVSALMILFGVSEVFTAFSHNFFGLSTSATVLSTALGVSLGVLYLAAGILALTMRRWALYAAVAVLVLDVTGRIAMVALGLYPLTSSKQAFSIVAGTVIAASFAAYLVYRRESYN